MKSEKNEAKNEAMKVVELEELTPKEARKVNGGFQAGAFAVSNVVSQSLALRQWDNTAADVSVK